jgi:hypothetical protein
MMAMTDDSARLQNSTLYQEFLAEREEILKHKWIESEKAGRDIGFERALTDWIVKHRGAWRRSRHFPCGGSPARPAGASGEGEPGPRSN